MPLEIKPVRAPKSRQRMHARPFQWRRDLPRPWKGLVIHAGEYEITLYDCYTYLWTLNYQKRSQISLLAKPIGILRRSFQPRGYVSGISDAARDKAIEPGDFRDFCERLDGGVRDNVHLNFEMRF